MKFALSHLHDVFAVLPEVIELIIAIKAAAGDGTVSADEVVSIGAALQKLVAKVVPLAMPKA